MAENYIAAVFGTKEEAIAFHDALLHVNEGGLRVQRAGVYGRGVDGDVELADMATDSEGIDFLSLWTGSTQEAVDELNQALPDGSYALLAHVSESDPSILDGLARQYGGTVYRRSNADLESAAYRRFTDSSAL